MEERPDNMSSHLSCQLARIVRVFLKQPKYGGESGSSSLSLSFLYGIDFERL